VASNLDDMRKGTDVALAAIRQLPADSRMHFVLIGNRNAEVEQLTAGLPVTVTGKIMDKARMVQLYTAADFTMVLSRADNLPYTGLESLACGRPVLGSAVGGIPEIVNDPRLGWLTPAPLDATAIARTLRQVATVSRSEQQRQFNVCRRSAEERYSINTMVDRYLALFHRLGDHAQVIKRGAASAASLSSYQP
jgi:glycosyltransferase involved in cell wall biosynthesis